MATHAGVVATGWFEIETGVLRNGFKGSSAVTRWDVPTVIKIGLGQRVQLNLGIPISRASGGPLGLNEVSAGVKWRLGEGLPVLANFAILPSVKLPSGNYRLGRGTGTTDFSLLLISSRTVGPVALDLNAGATRLTGGTDDIPRWSTVWTVSAGVPVRGRLGWTAELFSYPATTRLSGGLPAEDQISFLTGPTIAAAPWLVFDLGAIVPVHGPPAKALYAGATINAGRLWRSPGRPSRK